MRSFGFVALLLALLRGQAGAQTEADLAYRQRAIVYPEGVDLPHREGRRLGVEEFYALVGHPELGVRYEARRAIGIAALAVGAAAFVGGLFALVGSIFASPYQGRGDDGLIPAALGGMVFGVLNVGLAPALMWTPLPHEDARVLADQHNRALRLSLGLPDLPPRTPAPGRRSAPESRWLVGPGTVFWQF